MIALENSLLRPCVHDERYDEEPAVREYEVEIKQLWTSHITIEASTQEEAEDIAWEKYEDMTIDDFDLAEDNVFVEEV